jgi:hypothetical protein
MEAYTGREKTEVQSHKTTEVSISGILQRKDTACLEKEYA